MATKTEAIKAFLMAYAPKDLADLYSFNQEVQVTVAKDKGERTESDFKGKHWHGFTDGIQTWKAIRIPFHSNTEPEFEDTQMTYDLFEHAEGIGMTGWDWKNRQSRWVAFDFDAITGHSDKHAKKLTDIEIQKIGEAVANIPWVTLRKSTGGKGRHIYVFLQPIETRNHNEHAAVARAVLSELSGIAGFDFNQKVDICGGNMWVWHRKLRTASDGLTIIKAGTALGCAPPNWRDYTKVVSGTRQRNLPWFIEEQKAEKSDIDSDFDELTGQRIKQTLDSEHMRVMNWLKERYPNAVWWDAENHMIVTHTALLKECHTELGLRGPFDTNAKGEERGSDINVFGFPLPKGAWALRRYTPGVSEHPLWEQDGANWTRTMFNREAELQSACRIHEGIEEASGAFWFATADQAQKAAALVGADLKIPDALKARKTKLKPVKNGRIEITIERQNEDPKIDNWIVEKSKLKRMFQIKATGPGEPQTIRLDQQVRHLVSENADDMGWSVRSDGNWNTEPLQHVKELLRSFGYKPTDVSVILGSSVHEPWKVVNKPFEKEYPANREWNRDATQLRYLPSENRDSLKYPTWLKILNHLGKNLDEAIKKNEWAKSHAILTGADYLKIWIASLFQFPREPLPYLFFYSTEQNTGKSTLHEAISLLVTKGVCRADTALISQSNFNGELEHAILCVVEETDLRKNTQAYNRIKDWVTSPLISIHPKNRQPHMVPNSTHWVQCANSHLYCPIFTGDSRITMIMVSPLNSIIPKKDILPMLEAEAPDFLAEILATEIPPSGDRLHVPVIITDDKVAAQASNASMLEQFLNEKTYYAPGHMILFSEVYDAFMEWIDPQMVHQWTKIRFGREIPPKFPKGRLRRLQGQVFIGNISWTEIPETKFEPKWILKEFFLEQVFNHQTGWKKPEETNVQ